MVHSVECLSEVQEDHSTDPAIVNLVINIGQEIDETRDCGVSLPEPRLAFVKDVMINTVFIQLSMHDSLHEFPYARQYGNRTIVRRVILLPVLEQGCDTGPLPTRGTSSSNEPSRCVTY